MLARLCSQPIILLDLKIARYFQKHFQTTPFPIVENRPTSSQLSITSTKAAQKDDKALKKTNSATKKEKSAGKGGRDKKDDKKKKKSKTEVKVGKDKGKDKNDDDNRTSSTQLSNYSDAET